MLRKSHSDIQPCSVSSFAFNSYFVLDGFTLYYLLLDWFFGLLILDLGENSAVAILPSMCTLLLQSCRELPPPGDLTNKSDDKENMSDVRIKVI